MTTPQTDPKLAKLLHDVEAIEAKITRAKALADRLRRLSLNASRKTDTRRKIILGGQLLAAARTDPALADLVASLIAAITREADRKPFTGLTIPDLIAIAADVPDIRRPRRIAHKSD